MLWLLGLSGESLWKGEQQSQVSLGVSSFRPSFLKRPVSTSDPHVLGLLSSPPPCVPSGVWSAWECQSEGNRCSCYFFLGSHEATLNTYLGDFFSCITLCLAGVLWKTCAISKLAFHTSQTSSCPHPLCSQNSRCHFSSWPAPRARIGRSLVQGLVRRVCSPERIKQRATS